MEPKYYTFPSRPKDDNKEYNCGFKAEIGLTPCASIILFKRSSKTGSTNATFVIAMVFILVKMNSEVVFE